MDDVDLVINDSFFPNIPPDRIATLTERCKDAFNQWKSAASADQQLVDTLASILDGCTKDEAKCLKKSLEKYPAFLALLDGYMINSGDQKLCSEVFESWGKWPWELDMLVYKSITRKVLKPLKVLSTLCTMNESTASLRHFVNLRQRRDRPKLRGVLSVDRLTPWDVAQAVLEAQRIKVHHPFAVLETSLTFWQEQRTTSATPVPLSPVSVLGNESTVEQTSPQTRINTPIAPTIIRHHPTTGQAEHIQSTNLFEVMPSLGLTDFHAIVATPVPKHDSTLLASLPALGDLSANVTIRNTKVESGSKGVTPRTETSSMTVKKESSKRKRTLRECPLSYPESKRLSLIVESNTPLSSAKHTSHLDDEAQAQDSDDESVEVGRGGSYISDGDYSGHQLHHDEIMSDSGSEAHGNSVDNDNDDETFQTSTTAFDNAGFGMTPPYSPLSRSPATREEVAQFGSSLMSPSLSSAATVTRVLHAPMNNLLNNFSLLQSKSLIANTQPDVLDGTTDVQKECRETIMTETAVVDGVTDRAVDSLLELKKEPVRDVKIDVDTDDHGIGSSTDQKEEHIVEVKTETVVIEDADEDADEGSTNESADVAGVVAKLKPRLWLSSRAVHMCIGLVPRGNTRILDHGYFNRDFNSDFVKSNPLLLRGGNEPAILAPLHHESPSPHWTLSSIDRNSGTINFYNSLNHPSLTAHAEVQLTAFSRSLAVRNPAWQEVSWQFIPKQTPQQPNGFDCGIYVVVMAFHQLLGMNFPQSIPADLWRLALTSAVLGRSLLETEAEPFTQTTDVIHKSPDGDIAKLSSVVRQLENHRKRLGEIDEILIVVRCISDTISKQKGLVNQDLSSNKTKQDLLRNTLQQFHQADFGPGEIEPSIKGMNESVKLYEAKKVRFLRQVELLDQQNTAWKSARETLEAARSSTLASEAAAQNQQQALFGKVHRCLNDKRMALEGEQDIERRAIEAKHEAEMKAINAEGDRLRAIMARVA